MYSYILHYVHFITINDILKIIRKHLHCLNLLALTNKSF